MSFQYLGREGNLAISALSLSMKRTIKSQYNPTLEGAWTYHCTNANVQRKWQFM